MSQISVDLQNYDELLAEDKKQAEIGVNEVNNELREQIRAIILDAYDNHNLNYEEIGKKIGYSGNYIIMLKNRNTFPKTAKGRIKLKMKFERFKMEVLEDDGKRLET